MCLYNYRISFFHVILGVFFSCYGFSIETTIGKELSGNDTVKFINKNDESFNGTLIADPNPGTIPTEHNQAVSVKVNANATTFRLGKTQNGQATLTGNLNALPEGKHILTAETYTYDKSVQDRKDLAFIVDTIPPLFKLLETSDLTSPKKRKNLLFEIIDDGSGVEADESLCNLQIELQGASLKGKNFIFKNNQLHLLVSFDVDSDTTLGHEKKFRISISLEDRAKNIGYFNRYFTARDLIKPEYQLVECVSRRLESRVAFASQYEIRISLDRYILNLSKEDTEILSVTHYRYAGLDYEYPVKIASYFKEKSPPELSPMFPFAKMMMSKQVEVISTNPAISVEKILDNNFSDNRVQFRITQKHLVPIGDSMDYLEIRYPYAQIIDPVEKEFCHDGNIYYPFLKESSYKYPYFESTYIPVFLEYPGGDFSFKPLEYTDKHLVQIVETTPMGGLETNKSWFEVAGIKSWFTENSGRYEAKIPVIEGKVHYKTAISRKVGTWQGEDGNGLLDKNTFLKEGDYLVAMAPPSISNVNFNRDTGKFTVKIKDEGTPLNQLQIQFTLFGKKYDFEFNTQTGQFIADLWYATEKIFEGSLSVTDLAGQRATKTFSYLGKIEEEDSEKSGPKSNVTNTFFKRTKQPSDKIQPPSQSIGLSTESGPPPLGSHGLGSCNADKPAKTILGNSGNGQSIVRECEKFIHMGVCYQGTFYSYPPKELMDKIRELAKQQGSDAISVGMENHIIQRCQTKRMDVLAPVVEDVSYNTVTGSVTAIIHDNGAPVSQLSFGFRGRNANENRIGYYKEHPFQFIPDASDKKGVFHGQFVPPQEGEIFNLQISAKDKVNNYGYGAIRITLPRNPPEVEINLIETAKSDKFLQVNNTNVTAHLIGSAKDNSGILKDQVKFWIDNQLLAPFYLPEILGHSSLYSKKTQSGYTFNFYSREEKLFQFQGHYGALLEEGNHTARFLAGDMTGLYSEASLDFTINFAPKIIDFKTMPGAIQDIGGPVLTAMIHDRGRDLNQDGISLTIDNKPVSPEKIFYDKQSGYLAIDGPFDLLSTVHIAHLVAVDTHNNKDEKFLRFLTGKNIQPLDSQAEMKINEILLWELENQNGDGQANPGEYIRLFISLFNDSSMSYEQCHTFLESEDDRIKVETDMVFFNTMGPRSVNSPLHGFDILIDEDILSTTSSDPYETTFHLEVMCDEVINGIVYDEAKEWLIPFKLPIYNPSIPSGISSAVKVELERLPYTTSEVQINLRGTATSSSSTIEQVVLFVNGQEVQPSFFDKSDGSFECELPLTEGPNIIEVQALDQSGAIGSATAVVTCNGEVTVDLYRLPRTTVENEIRISGTATSSVADIKQVMIIINGRPTRAGLHQSNKSFSFEESIQLSKGNNTIEILATDVNGSIGRATAMITLNTDISLILDNLPASTTSETISISGTVKSTLPVADVHVRVNGKLYTVRYNNGDTRFSITVPLAEGGNQIEAEAVNQVGDRGYDSDFINRANSYVAPRVTITSPANGASFICNSVNITGTFDTGSSTLYTNEGCTYNCDGDGEGEGEGEKEGGGAYSDGLNFIFDWSPDCSVVNIGSGSFSVTCDPDYSGGNFSFQVILQTSDGVNVLDSKVIEFGPCS